MESRTSTTVFARAWVSPRRLSGRSPKAKVHYSSFFLVQIMAVFLKKSLFFSMLNSYHKGGICFAILGLNHREGRSRQKQWFLFGMESWISTGPFTQAKGTHPFGNKRLETLTLNPSHNQWRQQATELIGVWYVRRETTKKTLVSIWGVTNEENH